MAFQLYYIASPALMGLLYLTHAEDTVFLFRLVSGFIFVLVFSVVFFATLLYSQTEMSKLFELRGGSGEGKWRLFMKFCQGGSG